MTNVGVGLLSLACLCGIGCDSEMAKKGEAIAKKAEVAAENGAKKAEEAIEKGAAVAEKWTEEEFAKAKEEFVKLQHTDYGAIEQKIKDLAEEEAKAAQAEFEVLKEKAKAMKDAAPEKFKELKEEISKMTADLKTKLGL